MPHLATGAGLPLAVKMDIGIIVGEQPFPIIRILADQIVHFDSIYHQVGCTQGQVAYRADMVFELAGGRALDGPVAAVMYAWSHFVEQRAIGSGEKFHRHDADIFQLFSCGCCQFARLALLRAMGLTIAAGLELLGVRPVEEMR